MNARCTGCNAHLDFKAKMKLSEKRCICMSRFEPMYFVRSDENPVRAHPVHRNHNGIEYRWDVKNGIYYLNPPTVAI